MKKVLPILLLIGLSGCYKKLELEGFDKDKWEQPGVCGTYRLEIAEFLIEHQDVLLEATQNEIESLLGSPGEHELYNRNQKFFHYRLTPSAECDSYETINYLSIRFNAIGRANLVQVMLREPNK